MYKKRMLMMMCAVLLVLVLGSVGFAAEGKYDFGGETLKIQICWSSSTPLSSIGEVGDYNWYDLEEGPRLQAHIEKVEEMFNVNIEFVHQGWVDDAAQVLREGILAGDEPFDYFLVGPEIVEMARDYLIQPLDEVLEDDFYDNYPPMFRRDRYDSAHTVNGKIYGFEGLNSRGEQHVIIWNKTFFAENDLPDIGQLFLDGDWTWDAFKNVARQATMDTNNDGKNDRIGVGFYHAHETPPIFAATNGASLAVDENGRQVMNLTDTAIVEAFEFIQSLLDEGVAQYWGNRNSHAMGITSADILPYYHSNIDGEWSIVPLPKGPNADDYVVTAHGEWNGVIPIYVDNPREVIEVIQALFRLSKPYIEEDFATWEENYWYNDPGFANICPDQYTLDTWRYIFENKELVPSFAVRQALVSAGYKKAITSLLRDGGSVGTALAELQPAAQAELNNILDQ